MTALRDPPRLEGEADVDFGRHAAAVASRWWLLLLGLVVGIVIALLVSVGGKDVYRASALVYPGQPLSPSSAQVQSLATNPTSITQIVRSEAALRRAAAANELAKNVISRISRGTDTKIASFRAQITAGQQELDGIDERAAATQRA